jgi:hypothetical protein
MNFMKSASVLSNAILNTGLNFDSYPKVEFGMAPSSFLLSSHLSGGLFEKIRTPGIPHKEKISTQQGNGFIGSASMVGHEINDVFRGMNRRLQGLKSDISDLKSIIIFEGVKAWQTLRPFALPVRITFCEKIDFYRGIGHRKLAGATPKISVYVGFGHRRNAQPLSFGYGL